jgi:hypothetical protein
VRDTLNCIVYSLNIPRVVEIAERLIVDKGAPPEAQEASPVPISIGVVPATIGFFFSESPIRQALLYFDRLAVKSFKAFEQAGSLANTLWPEAVTPAVIRARLNELTTLIDCDEIREIGVTRSRDESSVASFVVELLTTDEFRKFLNVPECQTLDFSTGNSERFRQLVVSPQYAELRALAKTHTSPEAFALERSISAFDELIHRIRAVAAGEAVQVEDDELQAKFDERQELEARLHAVAFMRLVGVSAAPVLRANTHVFGNVSDRETQVLRLVLSRFPMPQSDQPLERLIEFKKDSDSQAKRLALREWITSIAKTEKTLREIGQQLEFLVADYEERVRLHRLVYRYTPIEIVLATASAIMAALAGRSAVDGASGIFSLRQQRILAELKEFDLPGREVAYLHKVKHRLK